MLLCFSPRITNAALQLLPRAFQGLALVIALFLSTSVLAKEVHKNPATMDVVTSEAGHGGTPLKDTADKESVASRKKRGAAIPGRPIHQWVQFEKGSQLVTRVIVQPGDACPVLLLDGETLPTKERQNTQYKEEFPIKLCQAFISSDARKVTFPDGSNILLPKSTGSIGIIGDTGCRGSVQNCHDPKSYPASLVSQSLNKHKEVDFVVHVGDFIYLDSAKNASRPIYKTLPLPYGDKWETVEFEFFKPLSEILRSKAVLFARGNHESCSRAGKVWSVLFDVETEHVSKCRDIVPSYFVDIVDTRFLMFDSNSAGEYDYSYIARTMPELERNMKAIKKYADEAGKESILLTHRPFFAIISTGYVNRYWEGKISGCGFNSNGQLVRQLMIDQGLIGSPISMVMSGHIHDGQLTSFSESAMPLQIAVGNSGADLVKSLYDSPSEVIGCDVRSTGLNSKISNFYNSGTHFGFAIMEKMSKGSKKLTYYDYENKVLKKCDISGRQFMCE